MSAPASSSSKPASEQVVDAAERAAATAGNLASQTANTISAKANELSAQSTGKTVQEHGATISETASNLAHQATDYAKSLFATAENKADQAATNVERKVGETPVTEPAPTVQGKGIGELVNDGRNFIGKVLDQASHAVAVQKPADSTNVPVVAGEKDLADKAANFVDQARNVLASGLKKAEEVVVGHPAGQTLGGSSTSTTTTSTSSSTTVPAVPTAGLGAPAGAGIGGNAATSGSTVPGVAPGTGAQEPYTSNLMGGVKQ